MNKGLDERLIPDGQYRDALNVEVSASEGAGVGALENIKGNTNVSNQTFTANAQSIVLEYVSDGMENGDDDSVTINKLAEDYIYSYVRWAILDNKIDTQEYVVRRAKKEKMAKLRNAKIRLSNMHSGRLLMTLRGRDKWIK